MCTVCWRLDLGQVNSIKNVVRRRKECRFSHHKFEATLIFDVPVISFFSTFLHMCGKWRFFSVAVVHKYKLLVIIHNSRLNVLDAGPFHRNTNIWKLAWFVELPNKCNGRYDGFDCKCIFMACDFGNIVLWKLSINRPVYFVNFVDHIKNSIYHVDNMLFNLLSRFEQVLCKYDGTSCGYDNLFLHRTNMRCTQIKLVMVSFE